MNRHGSQRLVHMQRVIDEKLKWQDVLIELEEPYKDEWNGATYTRGIEQQIIDLNGVIYHGIILDDGSVETVGGYLTYGSVKTYEGFKDAEYSVMYKRYGIYGKARHHLYYNEKTCQVFALVRHPSVGEERVYSMDAIDVACWLSDIDNREEPITYDTELHSLAIGLPERIINIIARHLPGSPIDWIRCILAETLGDITLAGPPVGKPKEGDTAFTAEQVREGLDRIKSGETSPVADEPAPATAEQIREVVDRIKARNRENDKADSTGFNLVV
jgi:hypothetical protein